MSKMNFSRQASLFLTLLILLSALTLPLYAAEIPTTDGVKAVYVLNLEYGEPVLRKNENDILYPASSAKLVTALVAASYFSGNTDTKIEISPEMYALFSGRCLGFSVGEKVTVDSLLHAMLIGGYNDAAVALAMAISGDLNAFASRMNETVKALGTKNTNYTNPTGLHDPQMVTTAADTALIGKAIRENEYLFDITKKPKYTLPTTNKSGEWTIYTRNHLISAIIEEDYFYSYADGLHAGSTDEGGTCVISSGELGGLSYICVVLGGESTDSTSYAFPVAKNALRYALSNFEVMLLRSQKQQIDVLPVRHSATVEQIGVFMSQDLTALLSSDINTQESVSYTTQMYKSELNAPFESGLVVGKITAKDKNGKPIAQADLIVKESVEAHGFLLFMANMKNFITSPLFFVMLILIVLLITFWFFFVSKVGKKHRPRVRKREQNDSWE